MGIFCLVSLNDNRLVGLTAILEKYSNHNASKVYAFCHVALVGNLSLQGNPEFANFQPVNLLGPERSKVNITVSNVVVTYRLTINAIDVTAKRRLHE
jgi:hypothetical protein